MDKRPVPKPLTTFVRSIKKQFAPTKIILFGSRARGQGGKWSDYDLLILSDSFSKLSYLERLSQVYKFHPRTIPLDVICLTPKEYNQRKREPTIISEIAKEGVELAV
ncbi:MAG TPA: nucleotidyltransferase domain-containing protein [Candidatus Nanoarchaeia archaeon]|nr:nucleotidyltransferase domain-containing protein [Candidatus Nanoarchaeia archaeon]